MSRTWIFGLLGILIPPAFAHDLLRSESRLQIDGREVRAHLVFNLLDFPPEDRLVQKAATVVKQHYGIQSSGAAPEQIALIHNEVTQGHELRLDFLYKFGSNVGKLEVTSTLQDVLGASHRHLMSVVIDGKLHEEILDATMPKAEFTATNASALQVFWRFARLGVEHIFTGYDHLAFLLGLMIATSSLRSLVKVITAFTIAHSITLALATLGVVNLPARLTESLIALSIVYVAVENLLGVRAVERQYITFLFGLVHGFGFSNVLRDMELPRSSLALSLFSFNVGVEIGQVVFILLLFPVLEELTRSGWHSLRPALSGGVACLAVYWFVQRAFLSQF